MEVVDMIDVIDTLFANFCVDNLMLLRGGFEVFLISPETVRNNDTAWVNLIGDDIL